MKGYRMKLPLSARIEQASKVFPDTDILKTTLSNLGVDDSDVGLSVLEFIEFDDFAQELRKNSESVPPIPRLKLLWSIFKSSHTKAEEFVSSGLTELIKTIKPMAQWSNVELTEKYGKDGPIQVHEELAKRVRNRFAIIFNEDESVDIENSLSMIKTAQYRDTPQVYALKGGDLREVYRVGEFPMQVLYECPLHSDVLLLDGYCEECCDRWDTTDSDKNAMLRLITENEKGIDIPQYRDKSMEELKKRFPKVYLLHKSLKEEDGLPRLKRKISKPKNGDPFRVVGTHKSY